LEKELKDIRKGIETGLKGNDKLIEGEYEAFYTYRDISRMDTEKLLALLKRKGYTDEIDTVEVPNQKVVDDLIYSKQLSVEEVAECIISGQSKVLNVIQTKGGK
jgi:hypothetical protein